MDFEIVVPTLNGARWLGQILAAYRKIGAEPLYVVDHRSDDGTEALLRSLGARVCIAHQDVLFIEDGIVEQFSRLVDRAWILRLDDDEFPSLELLKWAARTVPKPPVLSWRLQRLTVYKEDGRVKYSRATTLYHSYPESPLIDPQCRLYRHRDVTYVNYLHTAGFEQTNTSHAPASANLLHLDVLLRNPGERFAKLRRYEGIKPGSSWKYAYHYLPELFPDAQNSALLKTREFDGLIASLPEPLPQTGIPTDAELKKAHAAAARNTKLWLLRRRVVANRLGRNPAINVLARKSIAEFLCTSARMLRKAGLASPRFTAQLHDIGALLYSKAMSRRSSARPQP
jgi:glycosyltransferase involved in cell wall biosynthesis